MPEVLRITSMQCLRVMKLIFCELINIKVFWKSILYFDWFGQAFSKHSDRFAIFLCYLKKDVRNVVDFLHVGKHQSFL